MVQETSALGGADDAAAVAALDVQFLHHALLQQGDAGFLRREVDEELFSH